ncbi:hypothetical protein [Natronomonas moolapensis]|nr:hypothetical protein [Natronomonas moolapensis]
MLRAYPELLVFPLVGGLSGVGFLLTLFGGLVEMNGVSVLNAYARAAG